MCRQRVASSDESDGGRPRGTRRGPARARAAVRPDLDGPRALAGRQAAASRTRMDRVAMRRVDDPAPAAPTQGHAAARRSWSPPASGGCDAGCRGSGRRGGRFSSLGRGPRKLACHRQARG